MRAKETQLLSKVDQDLAEWRATVRGAMVGAGRRRSTAYWGDLLERAWLGDSRELGVDDDLIEMFVHVGMLMSVGWAFEADSIETASEDRVDL